MNIRCGPRGLDHRLFGRIRVAHAEVLRDGAVKKEGVLVDDGDHAPHRLDRQIPEILPAQCHPPLDRVEEPQDQSHDRGFPAAARTDEPHALPSGSRSSGHHGRSGPARDRRSGHHGRRWSAPTMGHRRAKRARYRRRALRLPECCRGHRPPTARPCLHEGRSGGPAWAGRSRPPSS